MGKWDESCRWPGWLVAVLSLAALVAGFGLMCEGADRAAQLRRERIERHGCQERAWCWGRLGLGEER